MSPDYWGKLLVELADPLEGLLSKNLPMASLNHTTFEFGATKTHPHPIILCCTRARRTNCQQPAPEGIFFFLWHWNYFACPLCFCWKGWGILAPCLCGPQPVAGGFKYPGLSPFFIFGYTGSSWLGGLSLVAGSGGHSSLRCSGFLLQWLLWAVGTGCSVHGLQ